MDSSTRPRLNPSAWLLWTACAATAALLVRNPWYLLGLAGVVLLVGWRLTGEPPGRGTLALAGSIILASTAINLLFSRAGDTVLLEFDIPVLGGPYTLEAFLFGLSAGLQVVTLLLVMGVFSRAVTAADLLRRTPRGLYPIGVAATIGLTFAPHARQAFLDLREARQLRGALRGSWREAPRLLTPMVFEALERAMDQAESLAARGWASTLPVGNHRWQAALAYAAIAAAVLLCAAQPHQAILAGGLLVVALIVRWMTLREDASPIRHQLEPWRPIDTLVAAFAAAAALGLLWLSTRVPGMLGYYPYPTAYIPPVAWPPLAAILCLAVPAGVGRA